MLKSLPVSPVRNRRPIFAPLPSTAALTDVSPFGLQAFTRERLQIIRPECLGQLSLALALRGTPQQIQDEEFARKIIANRPDWMAEFQVVRLIERSLWIEGQSDLVMTMTPNPSQIPDNPPPQVQKILTQSYVIHPEATVWYGVPLFGEESNKDGLPLPVTATEVREEHQQRIQKAQAHALRWRLYYRTAARIPGVMAGLARQMSQTVTGSVDYWKRFRRDSKRRAQAANCAHMEYCRTGRTWTEIPEHTTSLGEMTCFGIDMFRKTRRLAKITGTVGGVSAVPYGIMGISSMISAPLLTAPLLIIPMDPFLFIELPEEPGKLRFLGHWYWQRKTDGKEVLHLHV